MLGCLTSNDAPEVVAGFLDKKAYFHMTFKCVPITILCKTAEGQNQNEITNRFHTIKRLQRIKRFRGDWQRRSRQAAHSLKSSDMNYRIFK